MSEMPEAPTRAPFLGGRLRLGQAAFAAVYADVLLAVLSLAFVPYLISRLGTEPYGILGIVSMIGGQLGILHVGIGTAATRLVAESVGRGGEGLDSRLTGVAVVSAAASLAVGAVFLIVAPTAWRGGFNVSPETLPLALAAVPAGAALIALAPAAAAMQGVLMARERFLFASALRVYQGGGRLAAAVAAVSLGGGVAAILWAQAIVDLSAVLLGWMRSWHGIGRRQQSGAARSRSIGDEVRMVLKAGMPLALVSFLAGLLVDVEKLAIGLSQSVEDFTYYTVPYNAVIKFLILSGAVWRVMMPRSSALYARGERGEVLRLTERADRILAVATLGILAPIVAVAPELLRLWVGQEFVINSTLAMRILILGVGVNSLAFPAGAIVAGSGKASHLTLLYAAEVVVHLVVVYLLVTAFGLAGAATAWTLRVMLDTLAQRVLAERTLGLTLGDGLYVWGTVGLLAVFVFAAPLLSLPVRIAVGALYTVGCLFLLMRGGDGMLLVDGLLPWRWGKGGGRSV